MSKNPLKPTVAVNGVEINTVWRDKIIYVQAGGCVEITEGYEDDMVHVCDWPALVDAVNEEIERRRNQGSLWT